MLRGGNATALGFLVLVSCQDTEALTTACSTPCYSGPPETAGVGECRVGAPVCFDGGVQECRGAVFPTMEVCDGKDNDCDGRVDELAPTTCGSSIGACKAGRTVCASGEVTCRGSVGPTVEQCDGLDNDCNGFTDDVGVQLCYSGSQASAVNPPCRAGISICLGGNWTCIGEILPRDETCNSIDDDCDGQIDEMLNESFDFVFVIDRSCSMEEEMPDVVDGLSLFAARRANMKVAVVELAGEHRLPFLALDLRTPDQFIAYLQGLSVGSFGQELSYDAIAWISNGSLPFSWTAGARRAIVFIGDESGQSSFGFDEVETAQFARDNGFTVFGLVHPDFAADYDLIASETRGFLRPLSDLALLTSLPFIEVLTSSLCR